MREARFDIAVIGGSTGGCAAALSACRAGHRTFLSEPYPWIGGQLTSQAVPPDEHRNIEYFGCTQSYRAFRNGVRDYYKRHFPMTAEARAIRFPNMGGGIFNLCHEMRVGVHVLETMLAPYVNSGRLTIFKGTPVHATVDGDRVLSVVVRGDEESVEISAAYFLDGTDEGELLPMTGCEYVIGAESQQETGEPHAPWKADPMNQQALTWCMAAQWDPDGDHTIEKPEMYEFWRSYRPACWPNALLSRDTVSPYTLQTVRNNILPSDGPGFSFFKYRQIVDASKFVPGTYPGDVTIINWPQNDYLLSPVIDVSPETRKRALYEARQLSLSLLYWLQTEAERPDGGAGYKGFKLRPDVVGTSDGLAMAPYIRESRRIKAEMTVVEQHISPDTNREEVARYDDTVGIGAYRMDLHPSTGGDTYIDIPALMYEIPLGSLIPIRMENLLPACKNLGVTHLTNGCYRVHPAEWGIGEAAGHLAAFSLRNGIPPRMVRASRLTDLQNELMAAGIEIHWPNLKAY